MPGFPVYCRKHSIKLLSSEARGWTLGPPKASPRHEWEAREE